MFQRRRNDSSSSDDGALYIPEMMYSSQTGLAGVTLNMIKKTQIEQNEVAVSPRVDRIKQ